MARPVRADAEATRGRILEVARGMFSARGLGATTMRGLAREAGVTMATIHHYFGGKDELFRACVEAMYEDQERLRVEIQGVVEGWSGSREELGAFIDEAVRRCYAFARRHRESVRLMQRTVVDAGELDADTRARYLLPVLDGGAELLAPLLGVAPERVRCALLSLNYLIARFAITTPRELALVTGNPEASEEEAIAVVEDYLVSIARDQLTPGGLT